MKSIQRFLAVTLVLTTTCSPSYQLTASASTGISSSSQGSSWAQPAIRVVKGLQLMQGDPDGSFRPLEEMTRQEFATVLSRVLQLDTREVKRSSFHDVSTADWGYEQIHAVRAAGLMLGDPAGNFHPNDSITREELAVVLVRAAQIETMGMGVRLNTADAATVSDWARDSVQAAIERGLMRGDGVHFYPQETAKREEVAVVALELFRQTQESPLPIVEDLDGNTVQINGTVYEVSERLRGLFQPVNAGFLIGAKVKFELSGNSITGVTYLESAKNGVSLDAGNSAIEGELVIRGHEVHLDNLQVSKSIQFLGSGPQHVTVGSLTAPISELRNPELRLEFSQKTHIANLRAFANASLVTGGAVVPLVVLEEGVQELKYSGRLGTVVYNSKTDVILSGKGDIDEVKLAGSGELRLDIDGTVNTATVENSKATCILGSPATIVKVLVLGAGQTAGNVVDNFPQAKDQILKVIVKGSGDGGGTPSKPKPDVDPVPAVNKPPQSKTDLQQTITVGGPALILSPPDLATDSDGDSLSFSGAPMITDATKALVSLNAAGQLEISPLMAGNVTVSVKVTDAHATTPIAIMLKIQPQPDTTAPVITNVEDNQTYTTAVAPNSTDADILSVTLTQDGAVVAGYALGKPISENGTYELTVTDEAGNSTVVHFVVNIDTSLPVVLGILDNQTYQGPVTPTSPDIDIETVRLTQNGTEVTGYALGTPISADGVYELTVTDLEGKSTVLHFSIDTVAPVVTGVVDSQPYATSITPTSVDTDIQLVELTRNGTLVPAYVLGTEITTDGNYVLRVVDRAGNSTVLTFTLDMNAPLILGVADARTYANGVTPISTDTDLQTVTLTRDGIDVAGYTLGTEIRDNGVYVLTVIDLAGHSTVLHFVIDTSVPVVTGVVENGSYHTAVTPTSSDTDIQLVTLLKNDTAVAGYTLGTLISEDGRYVLTVTDQAGGSTVLHFSIDSVAPVVTGLVDNFAYGTPVTPTSSDTDIQTTLLTRNGVPVSGYALGTEISASGTYELTVTDLAGNTTVFHFSLDTAPPVVNGVLNNHIYASTITPTSPDTDIQTVALTHDGTTVVGYVLGTPITQDGTYVLTVTDGVGHATELRFGIDTVVPVVVGISDNLTYTSAVTPTSSDTDIQSVQLTKNSVAVDGYTLGMPISADGTYVLVVTDQAGNNTVLHFILDGTAPVITGVLNNHAYATAVTASSADTDIQTVTLTKNGTAVVGYALGSTISGDGSYVLSVTDLAGNSTVLNFSIDTMAPVVTGVLDNQTYVSAVTPSSSDTDIQTVTLTRNGSAVAGYALGTAITGDGSYVLTVLDLAGNTTVFHFEIDTTAPLVTGVLDAHSYRTSVTPTSSNTDIQTVTLTKNGTAVAGYALGTAITQDGAYVLVVTDQAGNSTTLHFSLDTVAPVVTGIVDNELYASAVTPSSSDTDIQTVSLTNNGTVVAGYMLGTPISPDGSYVLTLLDQAGNATVYHFAIDTTAPTVTGVQDDQAYGAAVTPSTSDSDIQTVTLTKNGTAVAGYSLGTAITTDGNYELTVTDHAGNTSIYHFSLDTVAPVVTGVVDNHSYAMAVTPSSTDTDIQTVTLTQDGTPVAGYVLGTIIVQDGSYVLTVIDGVGHATVLHFAIDTVVPVITGVGNNQTYTTSVTPISSDTDLQSTQLMKNGAPVAGYSLGTAISADGTYELTVTDRAGNSTVLHFTIDMTPPVVTGVLDNHLYNTTVTPTSADTDLQTVTLTRDGIAVAYSLGTAISADGSYVLTVTDHAGNSTVLNFSIDTIVPMVSGVIDNHLYTSDVTPTSADLDIQTVTLTRNGTAVGGYALGTVLTDSGTYVLIVIDHAGNSTVLHFGIDTIAPVVTGVLDNHSYGSNVTPTSSDSDIQSVSLTKNGLAVAGYMLGDTINQDGSYVLVVTDFAGNSTALHFIIDTVAPLVTGIADNQLYTSAVTPDSSDTDIQTVTLTKNGTAVVGYTIGSQLAADGSYLLTVVDQAGNTTVLHFAIDTLAPAVSGVLDNHDYATSVTPSTSDADIQTVTLTKNGMAVAGYTLGTAITTDGSYVLTVTDHAGNSTVLHFSIDMSAPLVTGVAENQLYATAVTPTSSDTDIQTTTLTKNGTVVAGYVLGTAITDDGTYVLSVSDSVGNTTVRHFTVDTTAPLVIGVSDGDLYATSVTPDSSDTDIQTVTLKREGATVAGYTLGTALTLDGNYELTVTDHAGNSTVLDFVIDTTAPVVTGVLDTHIYASTVTPTSADTDIQTTTLTQNGTVVAGYTLGSAITQDGVYVLMVVDHAGNSTVRNFTIDTVAPVILNLIDNHIYTSSVTPASADTDLQTVALTRNGSTVGGYALGTAISADGSYVLTVLDHAGNTTVFHFSIDTAAPIFTGVLNNQEYASAVTPNSSDLDIQTLTLTRNGLAVAGYVLGTAITADGTYELTATDYAGNSSVMHFSIDTTAPLVSGVADNQLYMVPVTPSSTDTDIQTVTLTKNGSTVSGYTLGTAITQNGTYVLTVTDGVGNTTVLHFSIDQTAPVVTGVLDNQLYNTAVTPSSSDSDIQSYTLTRNGVVVAGFSLGTTLAQDGTYVLSVTDQAGNATVLHFAIDQAPPVVTGLIDNQLYNSIVTPSSSDTDIQTVTLTKNGTAVAGYALGTAIVQDGSYVLTVLDIAGNSTTFQFTLDMTAPVITGVVENQIYASGVTPMSSDTDIQTVTLTKNGTAVSGYALGTTVSQHGTYLLTVTDHAGNSTVAHFSIDTQAPVVTGVLDNQLYAGGVTPISSATDIQTVTLTRNGVAVAGYVLGTLINTDGTYVLTVVDGVGNTTVSHFKIDTTAPAVTGLVDNQIYAAPVTPNSSDTDIQSVTLTKNGSSVAGYALGTAITSDGIYVLTVTDVAGNATVMHFSIDKTAPVVTGVVNNQLYHTSVTPASTDTDLQTVSLTRDGNPVANYTIGSTITLDGTYVLTLIDTAGNSTVLNFSIDQTAPLVTGVLENHLYNTTVTPASSDSDIQSTTLTKNGSLVAGYTLGTTIVADGTYVLSVTDHAGNSTVLHFSLDRTAPVIVGVVDNAVYATSVSPTSSDSDIISAILTKNGSAVAGYSLGDVITQTGTYVLTVTDQASNSTVLHFQVDKAAPVITGVLDNMLYNTTVTPTSGDTDIQTTTLTKNGSAVAGYNLGTAITLDGTYVLTVTDAVGNATLLHFAIDQVAPTINGVVENQFTNTPVTPTSSDTDIQSVTLTRNGSSVGGYALGTVINTAGTYVLTVLDQAGNSSVVHFTYDTTAPTVTGVIDNQIYNTSVTPSSADTDLQTTVLTKNGSTVAGYNVGQTVTQNGTYVLTVTDKAGNSTVKHFTIDTTPPVVTGVTAGQTYSTWVTPTSSDTDIQAVSLTKNGSTVVGYALGNVIKLNGSYVLTVTDQAGNNTVVNFTMNDTTAPTITGVTEGTTYTASVTPTSSDADIQSVTLTRYGSPVAYTLGSAISTYGSYTLTVTDINGNSRVVNFSLRLSFEETLADTSILTFAGSWSSVSNGSSGGSAKYAMTAGTSYSIKFTGTYIQVFGYRAANNGIADIYLDGTKVGTYDFYNATNVYKVPFYTSSGLTYGSHTLQVSYTGTKNASSSNTLIDLDYFTIQ